jgi:hypothetical protein
MISIVNMIPKSLSGETNQDSEPGIAVNPNNTQQIAGSAFTPDPLNGPRAPIYVSDDGGNTWILNSVLPSPISTHDITLGFSARTNYLFAGILVNTGLPGTTLNILRTNNFLDANTMEILSSRNNVDQPFIQATTVSQGNDAGKDRVYMGINDFNAQSGTATIDQSLDAGVASPIFKSINIEKRNTVGQNGPQIRPAIHSDGTIYGIFYGWRKRVRQSGNNYNYISDVVVVREDKWGLSSEPFSALIDPNDNNIGIRVASEVTVPWRNAPVLAFERIGGDLSIAVDPQSSSTVYIAWNDQQPDTGYTLHVRRSTDRGVTWSPKDLRTISNAKNPALAINSDSKVGFLYQQLSNKKRWDTHLELTKDGFATKEDLVLATVPSDTPPMTFLPYNGDYIQLLSIDKNFYGIFSAANTPDLANFPNGIKYQRIADFNTHTLSDLEGNKVEVSIDPIFFKVT